MAMQQLTVRAREVRVGDQVYNRHATHLPYWQRWEAVKEVRTTGEGSEKRVVIITWAMGDLGSRMHPEEAIAIQRDEA